MTDDPGSDLEDLAGLLRRLEEGHIHYQLASAREGAVMVQVAVPGERWEIEFFPNRPLEIEVFRSDGSILGSKSLEQLFGDHADAD